MVGLLLSGIVALATKGEAKVWLRGISPTVFFIGAFGKKNFSPPVIEGMRCVHAAFALGPAA